MWDLAQATNNTSVNSIATTGISVVFALAITAFIVAFFVGSWKIFVKAGHAGWKALIPIYSTVITCRIVGISGWNTLLIFVPLVNFFFEIYLAYKLALSFGRSIGTAILLILTVGYLILGFGDAEYIGPSSHAPQQTSPPPQPPVPAPPSAPANPAAPAA
jgi:hypothetical protein